MSRNLNLRLHERDISALATAATVIAGPNGARYVRPMTILRKALEAFNEAHRQPQQGAGQ